MGGAAETGGAIVKWANVGRILGKDLRLGPRSPIFLWALVMPFLITVLVRGVFGGLFESVPRLGIVDLDHSVLVDQAQELAGIDVAVFDDPAELRHLVEANDLDAGLVLPDGFDEAVRAGRRPPLELFVAGESLASDRLVVAISTLELVRQVAGEPAPVEVQVVDLGEEGLDLTTRLLPLIVIYAVAIAGGFLPGASLVEEKEKGTISALLVTPTTMSEILAAKALLGLGLSLLTGVAVLAINVAFGAHPVALVAGVVIGAVMMAEFGLLIGIWARDTNTLFTAWKTGGIFLFFPVVFPIWPELPQWIARVGPTFYFLDPIFRVATENAGLAEVWPELAIGGAICVALVPVLAAAGRRLERSMASGARVPEEARAAA